MGHTQDPANEKKRQQEKEERVAKSRAKAKAIDKTVAHCRREPDLSFSKTSVIYDCSKQSISNHFNADSSLKHSPDVYVNLQRLTLAEKATLVKHIDECYLSGFLLHVPHVNDFANEILRNRGDTIPMSVNWHLNFLKQHNHIKTKFSRPFAKARVMQERADVYIEFFRRFCMLCKK